MNAYELIEFDSQTVRTTPSLMAVYIEVYKANFGKIPTCIPCGFTDDFKKLKNKVKQGNFKEINNKMEMEKEKNINFKLKFVQNKILTYRKNGKAYRLYDSVLTPEFVKEFLTHGSEEEIEERKKLFKFVEFEKLDQADQADQADQVDIKKK